MIANPFYLISILSSSFLAFIVAAFGVELVIKLLGIKHHRIRSLLRLFPFISLIVDILSTHYTIAQWINPFNCKSCLQKFFLDLFYPPLRDYLMLNRIPLVDYLGDGYQHHIFSIIFILFAAASVSFTLGKIAQAILLTHSIKSILKNGVLYNCPLENLQLEAMLRKYKVDIYVSDDIQVPLAAYSNVIIIPKKSLEILTPQEFEAAVAHELEHIKHHDPMVRQIYHLIAALFWWVPTRTWMERIEQDQELACDQNVMHYGIPAESIASALLKVSRQIKSKQELCFFAHQSHPILTRIQAVLKAKPAHDDPLLWINVSGLITGTILLLICFIWL